ncbi:MAG: hypothetical protein IJM39_08655 [Firmicutes bacterium]|nr:hypothetical protein [Bacillota bacterium]
MKNLDLLKAVGQIDEKYIEEADEWKAAGQRMARRRRWISVAASLVVVAGIGAYAISGGFSSSKEFNLRENDKAHSDTIYSNNTASSLPGSLPAITDKQSLPNKEVNDSDSIVGNQNTAACDLVVMSVENTDSASCEAGILVSNSLNVAVIFGDEFHILKQDESGWKELPYVNDKIGWDMTGYPVKPGGNWKSTVNWKNIYGPLDGGWYRLVKPFRLDGQDGDNICICDFRIGL